MRFDVRSVEPKLAKRLRNAFQLVRRRSFAIRNLQFSSTYAHDVLANIFARRWIKALERVTAFNLESDLHCLVDGLESTFVDFVDLERLILTSWLD